MNTRLAATISMSLVALCAMRAHACSYDELRLAAAAGVAPAKNVAAFAAATGAPALLVGATADAPAQSANGLHAGAPIVGMWRFAFTAPDGVSVIDWGFQHWHADGTELTNSGGQLPATGNFCMGAWRQHGGSYQLTHWAIAWNLPGTDPSDLAGLVNLRELVDVDRTGSHMSGTVTLDLYAPDGTTFLAHLGDGTVAATRVTP